MKNEKDIRTQILELSAEITSAEVARRLAAAGCSPSTADKLSAGRYPSNPKGRVEKAILKVLMSGRKQAG